MPGDRDPPRLPAPSCPSRYELTLEPDLDAATFAGTEAVAVEVVEPVTELLLNALELEIDEAWLEPADGSRRLDGHRRLEPEDERAGLTLDGTAQPGHGWLHARFRGVLNDKLVGFYRSTFTDDDGTEHMIATTQFEATDARRAFPCWDEPELKAVFAVTLVVDDGLTALSNAAEVSREPDRRRQAPVHFADTMKMSTYLVAFVVGPLEATEPVDVDGTPLRIATRPGKGHLTRVRPRGRRRSRSAFFADYYGIAYPGDKLRPRRRPRLRVRGHGEPRLRSRSARRCCSSTRSDADAGRAAERRRRDRPRARPHVVRRPRDDEVVERHLAQRGVRHVHGDEVHRRLPARVGALGRLRPVPLGRLRHRLARQSTRPIEYPVVSPEDAEGMFDVLTYEKGAAVVRMLEQYLGAEAFRDGIRQYLGHTQYGNTETTDLWDAIEAATGEPVRRIMDTWIFQGGYP